MDPSQKPSKKLEYFHLSRAAAWPIITAAAVLLGWQESVFLILLYSTYANLGADIGAWQAARAERRSLENPPQNSEEP